MTTFVNFVPSNTQPFQFQAILDGGAYTVVVRWNLFGQRYYLDISDINGELVLSIPMVGSPVGYDISLVDGYFESTLIWRVGAGQFEISP
jgi:hypothetical protein